MNFFAFKQNGGTAVDAVEQAIRVFEEHSYFNAGRGSCLNTSGEVECDALIMDGDKIKTGRYTVRRKHPKCYCKVAYCRVRYELDLFLTLVLTIVTSCFLLFFIFANAQFIYR